MALSVEDHENWSALEAEKAVEEATAPLHARSVPLHLVVLPCKIASEDHPKASNGEQGYARIGVNMPCCDCNV